MTTIERLHRENMKLREANRKALEYLLFMDSHGTIGPDADGNDECKRCMTALKRAISALRKVK